MSSSSSAGGGGASFFFGYSFFFSSFLDTSCALVGALEADAEALDPRPAAAINSWIFFPFNEPITQLTSSSETLASTSPKTFLISPASMYIC